MQNLKHNTSDICVIVGSTKRFLTQNFLSCIFSSRSVAVMFMDQNNQMTKLQVLASKATNKADVVPLKFWYLKLNLSFTKFIYIKKKYLPREFKSLQCCWLQFKDKKTTFLFQREILLTLLSITLILLIYLNEVTHLRRA